MNQDADTQNPINLNTLTSLWKRKQLCDAIVTSREQEKKWMVHKVVLASASPYFQSIFLASKASKERNKPYVLADVNDETLGILLNWIYTSAANFTPNNVQDVLTAADFYLIPNLVKECCYYMVDNMTVENCLGLHKLSKSIHIPIVESPSLHFILEKFESVYKNNVEFLDINKVGLLLEYLSSDLLNVKSEESVWLSILLWINHKKEERLSSLNVLLPTIRLSQVPREYIENEILKHPYIKAKEAFCSLIRSYINGEKRSSARWPHALIISLGGWATEGATNIAESYDSKLKCWDLTPSMNMRINRAYAGVCVLDKQVYVIGGTQAAICLYNCDVYNMEWMDWRRIANLLHRRCFVSVAELNGYIYAMGGKEGEENRLSSVERYDPTINEWSLVANMNSPRSDASAATLNGRIYIVGGFNGWEYLSSAEVYDPQTGVWTYIALMEGPRSGLSCVSHEGYIYAIGGNNGENRLCSGEKYNPTLNMWTRLPPMSKQRSNFGMIAVEDCILVAGGFNGHITIADAETLDLETMTWNSITPMRVKKSALSLYVIQGIDIIRTLINQNRTPQERVEHPGYIHDNPLLEDVLYLDNSDASNNEDEDDDNQEEEDDSDDYDDDMSNDDNDANSNDGDHEQPFFGLLNEDNDDEMLHGDLL